MTLDQLQEYCLANAVEAHICGDTLTAQLWAILPNGNLMDIGRLNLATGIIEPPRYGW